MINILKVRLNSSKLVLSLLASALIFGAFFVTRGIQAQSEDKPDLIVFGRHEGIHWKPFSVGKVRFHSMLSLDVPILMVPKELGKHES